MPVKPCFLCGRPTYDEATFVEPICGYCKGGIVTRPINRGKRRKWTDAQCEAKYPAPKVQVAFDD